MIATQLDRGIYLAKYFCLGGQVAVENEKKILGGKCKRKEQIYIIDWTLKTHFVISNVLKCLLKKKF